MIEICIRFCRAISDNQVVEYMGFVSAMSNLTRIAEWKSSESVVIRTAYWLFLYQEGSGCWFLLFTESQDEFVVECVYLRRPGHALRRSSSYACRDGHVTWIYRRGHFLFLCCSNFERFVWWFSGGHLNILLLVERKDDLTSETFVM